MKKAIFSLALTLIAFYTGIFWPLGIIGLFFTAKFTYDWLIEYRVKKEIDIKKELEK